MSVQREWVGLASADTARGGAGGHPCQGLYHRPAGRWPRVAVIAAHYSVDFAEHYLAEPLARRGIGFLGWNTRYRGADQHFVLDRALIDIGTGVAWLRAHRVDTVVLLGNSGGGSLMAAYHAVADGAPAPPAPGADPAGDLDLAGPGDLYVSIAAHPGRPDVLTAWLDPSVTDETDPCSLDPALDMYDTAHGPPYPAAFVARYRRAQRERNDRITRWAEAEVVRLAARGVPDRLFSVPRTWADLRFTDATLDRSDRPVPACYRGDPRRANRGPVGLAAVTSLRTWLGMWSLSASPCRAADHLSRVDVPALVVQATRDCGVFPSDAAAVLDALGDGDRTAVEVAGDHYFARPAGAREELADLVAAWVGARTGPP